MSLSNTITSIVFKVKRTQVMMMMDRHYIVLEDEQAIINYSVEQFYHKYVQKSQELGIPFIKALDMHYIIPPNDTLYVYYTERDISANKTGLKQLNDFFNKLHSTNENIRNIMLISETPFNPNVSDIRKTLPDYNIELYTYDQLYHNPMEHILVPKHEILSDVQAKQYLKKNKLTPAQLPKISNNDPIVRYLGAKENQIIRITRKHMMNTDIVTTTLAHRIVRPISILPPKSAKSKNTTK